MWLTQTCPIDLCPKKKNEFCVALREPLPPSFSSPYEIHNTKKCAQSPPPPQTRGRPSGDACPWPPVFSCPHTHSHRCAPTTTHHVFIVMTKMLLSLSHSLSLPSCTHSLIYIHTPPHTHLHTHTGIYHQQPWVNNSTSVRSSRATLGGSLPWPPTPTTPICSSLLPATRL